jgi:hypothetical protein
VDWGPQNNEGSAQQLSRKRSEQPGCGRESVTGANKKDKATKGEMDEERMRMRKRKRMRMTGREGEENNATATATRMPACLWR